MGMGDALAWLATKAENEATRLGAIKEIFDRAIGAGHKVVVVFKETASGAEREAGVG